MISDPLTEGETLMRELRESLIARRRALGWTQYDVAGLMGVKQSYVSDLEIGSVRSPGVITLVRWARALGYTPTVHLDILQ